MKHPPSDKQTPSLPKAQGALEDALASAVSELNNLTSAPPVQSTVEFVNVGRQLGKSMKEAARQLLNEAENYDKEIQQFVQKLSNEIETREREHNSLLDRLRKFGSTLLDAHHEFHNPTPIPTTDAALPSASTAGRPSNGGNRSGQD